MATPIPRVPGPADPNAVPSPGQSPAGALESGRDGGAPRGAARGASAAPYRRLRISPSCAQLATSRPWRSKNCPRTRPRRARRRGAVDDVEQPVVEAERAVEPHHVIERRHLHAGHERADAVRVHRGAEEGEVGGVREEIAVQRGVVGELVDGAVPHVPQGRGGARRERVAHLDRADLDGALPRGHRADRLGQRGGQRHGHRALGLQGFGRRHGGHERLVLEALFVHLERGLEAEDGLALLHGDDAAGGEAPPVAQPVDLVEDGAGDGARAHEVAVERVHGARSSRPPSGPRPRAPGPAPGPRRASPSRGPGCGRGTGRDRGARGRAAGRGRRAHAPWGRGSTDRARGRVRR